ncbi:hypothetical protein COCMIDRAFT_105323, partial [Bipolaris oryzae ATCC 44560]
PSCLRPCLPSPPLPSYPPRPSLSLSPFITTSSPPGTSTPPLPTTTPFSPFLSPSPPHLHHHHHASPRLLVALTLCNPLDVSWIYGFLPAPQTCRRAGAPVFFLIKWPDQRASCPPRHHRNGLTAGCFSSCTPSHTVQIPVTPF